jgi:hypothetical protein
MILSAYSLLPLLVPEIHAVNFNPRKEDVS